MYLHFVFKYFSFLFFKQRSNYYANSVRTTFHVPEREQFDELCVKMTGQNHIDIKTCDYQNGKVAMNIYQNFPYNDQTSNPAEFGFMLDSLANIDELVLEESRDEIVHPLHDGSSGQSSSCNLGIEENSQSEDNKETTCYHRMTPRGLTPVKERNFVENTVDEKAEQFPNIENKPLVQRAALDANCGCRKDNIRSEDDPVEEIAAYVQQSKVVPHQQNMKGSLSENQAEEINAYVRQSELPVYLSKTGICNIKSNVKNVNCQMSKKHDENVNGSVQNQQENQLSNVSESSNLSEDISVTCPLTSQTDSENMDSPNNITNAHLDRPVASPHLDRPVTSPHIARPVTSPHLDRPVTSPHIAKPVTCPHLDRPMTSPYRDRPVTSPHLDRPVTSPDEGAKLKSSSIDSDEGISHDPDKAVILLPGESDENQSVSLGEEDLFQTKMDSICKTSMNTGFDVDTNKPETISSKNNKNREGNKTNCRSDVESMLDSTPGGGESDHHHYLKHKTLNSSAFLRRKGSDDGYISNGYGSPSSSISSYFDL